MAEQAPSPAGKPQRKASEHPASQSAAELKEGNRKAAYRFLFTLWSLLVGSVIIWVSLHFLSSEAVVNQLQLARSPVRTVPSGILVTNPVLSTNGMTVLQGDGIGLTNVTIAESSGDFISGLVEILGWLRMDPTNSVALDQAGRVTYLSETDLRWYIGRDQATAAAAALKERTRRIDELQDRIVQQSLLEFRVKFSGEGLNQLARMQMVKLEKLSAENDFATAAEQFTSIVQGWSNETRKKVGEKTIFELNYGLANLARLRREQQTSIGVNLQPPRMHQIFWSSPVGALAEAVYWSILGTLINLILNVSQARSRGQFRRDEIWVCYSKLFYGPALSLILILTIYFGILNAGTELRFWLLPLLGFIFGYNTRKVAMMIDRVSEKFLGAVSKSVDDLSKWQATGAAHGSDAVQAEARPRSITEIREKSRRVLHSALVAAVLKQQKET